jgi:hypothetical protein
MQVRKVAVVATGALATAAAIGSTPAFAADTAGAPEVAPATVGLLDYEGKHRASDDVMQELAARWLTVAPEQSWSAPWEQEPPQILSVGSGSALSAGAWQQCGTHGGFILGGSAALASPATVLGDCRNGNLDVKTGGSDALISILDGTAISVASFQQCASGAGGASVAVPLASPATVTGSCDNGNISVGEPEDGPLYPESPGYEYQAEAAEQGVMPSSAPWEQEPPQILSAGSGSAASAGSWQQCAAAGPFILGGSAPVASPLTVLDGCRNGNLDIHGEPSDALFSVLDHTALSVASFQQCASGVGGAGIAVPVASPLTVTGNCDNGNVTVG